MAHSKEPSHMTTEGNLNWAGGRLGLIEIYSALYLYIISGYTFPQWW